MGKSLVGFGHAVRIVPFLDGAAAVVGCIEQLRREAFHHGLFPSLTRITDDPPETQRGLSIPIHFHRHLIVCSTNTARLHFQGWLDVVYCLLEDLQGLVISPLLDQLKSVVHNILSNTLLALKHDAVHKLLHQSVCVYRIGTRFSTFYRTFTWHLKNLSFQISTFNSQLSGFS